MTSIGRAALSVAVVVASYALERSAFADDSTLPGVDIAIVGATNESDELGRRIESWFRADHAPVSASSRDELVNAEVLSNSARPGVRVWIVVLERRLARVFFTVQAQPGEPPRYLVTEVGLEHELDEVDRERLAQVVYLSANGLWAGTFESSRAEVERALGTGTGSAPPSVVDPVPEEKPIARESSSIEIRTGLEYAARWTGDPGFGQLVGGNLRVSRMRAPYAIGGIVRASAIVPQSTSAQSVELGTHGVSFGIGSVATHAFNPRSVGMLEAGLGLDVIRYRASTSDDPSLRAVPDSTTLQPFAAARVGVRFAFDPVGLELQGILAVSMLHTHFDVERTDRRTAVIVPWLVQPGLAAGVSW